MFRLGKSIDEVVMKLNPARVRLAVLIAGALIAVWFLVFAETGGAGNFSFGSLNSALLSTAMLFWWIGPLFLYVCLTRSWTVTVVLGVTLIVGYVWALSSLIRINYSTVGITQLLLPARFYVLSGVVSTIDLAIHFFRGGSRSLSRLEE